MHIAGSVISYFLLMLALTQASSHVSQSELPNHITRLMGYPMSVAGITGNWISRESTGDEFSVAKDLRNCLSVRF